MKQINGAIGVRRRPKENAIINQQIASLQYLRAVAALSVVLYHASFYANFYNGNPHFLSTFGGGFGTFGVVVFFALSGYLMASQAVKMAGRPMMFLMHRLVRIYPIFWVICLIRIVVAIRLGNGLFDPLVLMLSPVGERDYPLGVEWSLVYEICFYLLICAIIAIRLERWIGLIGFAWLLSIIAHTWFYGWYSPQFMTSLLAIPMSAVCGAFAAGLVIPTVVAKGWIGPSALPFGALMIAAAAFPSFVAFSTIIIGIGCAALVAWAASAMQNSEQSLVLGRLGDWSYATYLIHVPILITLGVLLPGASGASLWVIMVTSVLALTPLFGVLDVVLHRKMRWAVDHWNWQSQAAVLTAFAVAFFACMALGTLQRHREAETVESSTGIEGTGLASLQQAGWREDDRLVGNLEPLARAAGLTYASGWVNNTQDRFNSTLMLLTIGNTSTIAAPRSYRFDLIKVFGLARFIFPAAFRKTMTDAVCPPGQLVQAIAISRRKKTYHILNSATCPA